MYDRSLVRRAQPLLRLPEPPLPVVVEATAQSGAAPSRYVRPWRRGPVRRDLGPFDRNIARIKRPATIRRQLGRFNPSSTSAAVSARAGGLVEESTCQQRGTREHRPNQVDLVDSAAPGKIARIKRWCGRRPPWRAGRTIVAPATRAVGTDAASKWAMFRIGVLLDRLPLNWAMFRLPFETARARCPGNALTRQRSGTENCTLPAIAATATENRTLRDIGAASMASGVHARAQRWRGCPRLVHGAGPVRSKGAVGKGWTTPRRPRPVQRPASRSQAPRPRMKWAMFCSGSSRRRREWEGRCPGRSRSSRGWSVSQRPRRTRSRV